MENCLYGGCNCLKVLLRILCFGLPQKPTYRAKVIMEKNIIYVGTKPFIVRALLQGMRIFNIPT